LKDKEGKKFGSNLYSLNKKDIYLPETGLIPWKVGNCRIQQVNTVK
jgi:hypothetical protein